jgi:four helix bundle protein
MGFAKIEDFAAFQKASTYWEAVNALLEKPGWGKNDKLRDQIRRAIDSITANLAEGFEQSTDRGFAKYVFIAKGSTAESRKRLRQAMRRRYITEGDFRPCDEQADEVARLLAGLAKYLLRSDRKNRGVGTTTPEASPPNTSARPSTSLNPTGD